MRLVFHFDKCTGCRICELVCSMVKNGAFGPRRARIRVTRSKEGVLNNAIFCQQCENAFCSKGCPTDALIRYGTSRFLVVDSQKCNGCGLCVDYCPIGAIWLDPKDRKTIICDLCLGEAVCARYCPTKALECAALG